MFVNRIDIPNRYGDPEYLVHIDNGMYKLYMADYCTITWSSEVSILSIDPAGSDFPIKVGCTFNDGKQEVTEIVWDKVCNCYFVIMKEN